MTEANLIEKKQELNEGLEKEEFAFFNYHGDGELIGQTIYLGLKALRGYWKVPIKKKP